MDSVWFVAHKTSSPLSKVILSALITTGVGSGVGFSSGFTGSVGVGLGVSVGFGDSVGWGLGLSVGLGAVVGFGLGVTTAVVPLTFTTHTSFFFPTVAVMVALPGFLAVITALLPFLAALIVTTDFFDDDHLALPFTPLSFSVYFWPLFKVRLAVFIPFLETFTTAT